MGQRTQERQVAMWVVVKNLPWSVSHPFYEKLNRLLAEHGFDDFVETQCLLFYAEKMGRPNLGLWMRTLTGIGTPRGLQDRWAAVVAVCFTLWGRCAIE